MAKGFWNRVKEEFREPTQGISWHQFVDMIKDELPSADLAAHSTRNRPSWTGDPRDAHHEELAYGKAQQSKSQNMPELIDRVVEDMQSRFGYKPVIDPDRAARASIYFGDDVDPGQAKAMGYGKHDNEFVLISTDYGPPVYRTRDGVVAWDDMRNCRLSRSPTVTNFNGTAAEPPEGYSGNNWNSEVEYWESDGSYFNRCTEEGYGPLHSHEDTSSSRYDEEGRPY